MRRAVGCVWESIDMRGDTHRKSLCCSATAQFATSTKPRHSNYQSSLARMVQKRGPSGNSFRSIMVATAISLAGLLYGLDTGKWSVTVS